MEYQYPLAEPDYTGKRTLDFTPFEEALAALSADRTAALDELLAEATLLDMQRLMAQGELSAAELVAYYVARIRRYDVGKLNAVMELNPQALADCAGAGCRTGERPDTRPAARHPGADQGQHCHG